MQRKSKGQLEKSSPYNMTINKLYQILLSKNGFDEVELRDNRYNQVHYFSNTN